MQKLTVSKLVSFAEVTSGSPTIGISSLSISECKLYADSNSFFKWGSEVYAPLETTILLVVIDIPTIMEHIQTKYTIVQRQVEATHAPDKYVFP